MGRKKDDARAREDFTEFPKSAPFRDECRFRFNFVAAAAATAALRAPLDELYFSGAVDHVLRLARSRL